MWRFILFLFLLGLVGAGLLFADYKGAIDKPIAFNESQRSFTIERGWSAKRIASELEQDGLIDKPHWFYLYARLSKKGVAIKSGEFNITGNPTIPELIDVFVDGQTVQYSATIIEGSTFKQMRVRLAAERELVQTIGDMGSDVIISALGLEGQHPEGLFFSDTYRFPGNTTDIEFLQRANALLQSVLTEEWNNRDPAIPIKTPYEALILASIVEK